MKNKNSKPEKFFIAIIIIVAIVAALDLLMNKKKAEPTSLPIIQQELPKTLQSPPDINSEYCKKFNCDKL